jgi:protein phosphatase
MRFFDLWGIPNDNGDIESYDYLFLGDYVDRGNHSLETICLLMALKVKFPEKIHLLRGNHEDRCINNAFGFAEECGNRLGEDPSEPDSVFNKINDLFDWLPLSAIIEDRLVCLHGGIG